MYGGTRTAICLTHAAFGNRFVDRQRRGAGLATRPVLWVVDMPPCATDIIALLIGHRLSERLGPQFGERNKPGAATISPPER